MNNVDHARLRATRFGKNSREDSSVSRRALILLQATRSVLRVSSTIGIIEERIVKSLTMISWELDPFYTQGGTAYAIRRLADQLTQMGIVTRVLLPDCPDARPGKTGTPLLKPMLLKMPPELLRAPRGVQCR